MAGVTGGGIIKAESPNGLRWHQDSGSNPITDIFWSNSQSAWFTISDHSEFIKVDSTGAETVLTSPDATSIGTWILAYIPGYNSGVGRIGAISPFNTGSGYPVWYSDDYGSTWSSGGFLSNSALIGSQYRTWSSAACAVACSGGDIVHTADFVTWTTVTGIISVGQAFTTLTGITYLDSLLLFYGVIASGDNQIATCANFTSVSPTTLYYFGANQAFPTAAGQLTCVAWDGANWAFGSNNGEVAYAASLSGPFATWTVLSSSHSVVAMVYSTALGMFVAAVPAILRCFFRNDGGVPGVGTGAWTQSAYSSIDPMSGILVPSNNP